MNREDEARKTLRKDIYGPNVLPGLDKFHVQHKPKETEWQKVCREHEAWLRNKAL